jgi:hypothetical protein
MGAAGVVLGGDSSAAAVLFDSSSQLFCDMLPRSHTSNLVSSPFTVPLEVQHYHRHQHHHHHHHCQQQQQSPETSSFLKKEEDRLNTTQRLFCLPRTHHSDVQERAFRNCDFEDGNSDSEDALDRDFEDALLHISHDFEEEEEEDSMSSSHDDDSEEDDSGLLLEEEELIGELRTPDIFTDDGSDDDYAEHVDYDDGSGGCALERRDPLLDNVYSLYRESRFSHLNETKLCGGAATEVSSSEARLNGQMEKFELLKAEMTKAANRQAAESMKKAKSKRTTNSLNDDDNEKEMRLQQIKKKIEIELRQDEKDDVIDDDGDSTTDEERYNDEHHEPAGCAEGNDMDEQGHDIDDDNASNNEKTRQDHAQHELAKDVDLARMQTDDVEVIHFSDNGDEWTDSDLSSSDSSASADTEGCASDNDDDDDSTTSSSSSDSENLVLLAEVDREDWVSDGLKSLKLMGNDDDEEQSEYGEDGGGGSLNSSFDYTIDLPENTLSFDFRGELPAGSNISLLEALVSDVKSLMIERLNSAAQEEDELDDWQEGRRGFSPLTRGYELETKHMSMTTINTESTGCSSQATAETSSPVYFLHDEGTVHVTPLSMILLPPLIAVNDDVKPPEVVENVINDVEDDFDDDDIELLSEEVNLDKHEATLSRRKRLLLRFRRTCLMCSENSRFS